MEEMSIYRQRAAYYDPIYHFKDYEGESKRLHRLLAGEGLEDGARILEAACGTGSYLVHLARSFSVAGFDLSEELLEIARQKLPDVPLFQANMADFTTKDPSDALLCLFSSVGYLYPEEELRSAASCFARAVRPGGILVVEPWLTEEVYQLPHLSIQTFDGDGLKLCRMVNAEKRGELSVFDMHWLALEKGGKVEHFVDHHELWLCPTPKLLEIFDDAGFEVRFEREGLLKERGLVVGRRRE